MESVNKVLCSTDEYSIAIYYLVIPEIVEIHSLAWLLSLEEFKKKKVSTFQDFSPILSDINFRRLYRQITSDIPY